MNNYDYIIVGSGASGLMMAYKMANDSFFNEKSILILDKEKKAKNDRTWCYWEKNIDEWQDIITKSWDTILFNSDSISKEETILPYQYKMIRSKDFYAKIWNHLATKSNITFKVANVLGIEQLNENAKVVTNDEVYKSTVVLNSVLFSNIYKIQQQYPVLQQHFVGFFVRTKTAAFNDATATFMDFSVAQKGNTRFMYVLPYTTNEALFEYTLFSKNHLDYNDYVIEIENYLRSKNISNYEIIEKEQGSIPMTSYKFWKHNSKNVIHIGTAGGWSKASTGFTFKNTTKKTSELINHIKQNKPLHEFHKINHFWFYDLLFLDVLSNKNYLGSTIFSQMFKNNATPLILKFLDEETTFLEDLKIQLKMPIVLFLKALLKRIF